jgi:hypothetical protein
MSLYSQGAQTVPSKSALKRQNVMAGRDMMEGVNELSVALERIAELEAALRLCVDNCIDPTEGEVALTHAREVLSK